MGASKTTRRLAELSKHRLREDQYELLLSTLSEQAHDSPMVLLDNMFPRGVPVDEIVASDGAHIAETVTPGMTFFLKLWRGVAPNGIELHPVTGFQGACA